MTASLEDPAATNERMQTSSALLPLLWDQAAVPLGLPVWQRHLLRNSFAAVPRLCRFEIRELRRGLAQYLAARDRSVHALVDPPTPLGWMIHMEGLDSSEDCAEDRRP